LRQASELRKQILALKAGVFHQARQQANVSCDGGALKSPRDGLGCPSGLFTVILIKVVVWP
jgi:hypothetical protein